MTFKGSSALNTVMPNPPALTARLSARPAAANMLIGSTIAASSRKSPVEVRTA